MALESWVRTIKEVLLSWPFVVLAFLLVFRRELRGVLTALKERIEKSQIEYTKGEMKVIIKAILPPEDVFTLPYPQEKSEKDKS